MTCDAVVLDKLDLQSEITPTVSRRRRGDSAPVHWQALLPNHDEGGLRDAAFFSGRLGLLRSGCRG